MALDKEELTRLTKGTFIDLLGIHISELGDGRAIGELEFRSELRNLTGVFHGGAILSLIDTIATVAAMTVVNPDGAGSDYKLIPLAMQISNNFTSNVAEGKITCAAEAAHRGRSTIVVEAKVRSESGKLLALATVTLFVPSR